MSSPLAALTWEIWRRGRRTALLAFGCVLFCALINLAAPEKLRATATAQAIFNPLFGLMMVLSMFLIMGIFNYTEHSSSRDWSGFPYRLFALPVRTWQLVALPMSFAVVSVELVYGAWIKLVWTHESVPMPEWFAVVLGAYMVFYQTALWSLAGFRIIRVLALSLGGVSIIVVACLPLARTELPPWLSEARSITFLALMTFLSAAVACAAVARQRCGGGRRQNWLKTLLERGGDVMPRRLRDFATPSSAQYWFEWRRTGLLLPLCAMFALLAIFVPFSWIYRDDPWFTINTLLRIFAMPIILAFAIGKAFIKPDFWSMNFALPPFLAVRALSSGEFVVTKMKVAVVSVVMTWLLVLGFVALWLPLWADTAKLQEFIATLRLLHPNAWPMIVAGLVAGFVILTWRCLVSGLWIGLSGNRTYYVASSSLQVVMPALLLLAAALCTDEIDAAVRNQPGPLISAVLSITGCLLAFAVIAKIWFVVFAWATISARRAWQYLLVWSGATLGFVTLAALTATLDTYRLEHQFVLAAFLVCPFARLGLAPRSLAKNRHR